YLGQVRNETRLEVISHWQELSIEGGMPDMYWQYGYCGYNGADGSDFDHEMTLKNIDFGTFHLYPDWWSKTVEWSNQWIVDHGAVGRDVGKPVVFEEYGWLQPDKRLEYLGQVRNETRLEVISHWQELSIEGGMPDMYWQYGYCGYSYGCNHNDGFTIYLNDTEADVLIYQHAAKVNGEN
ncbi:hypothetical protein ACHAO5_008543, partial [Verticillium nonalfalfae]